MPEKAHIITLVAVAVAVGLGGYLVGSSRGEGGQGARGPEVISNAEPLIQETITAEVDDRILLTNGVGTGSLDGATSADLEAETRRQFLEASEKRTERLVGKVEVKADLDRDSAMVEDTTISDLEMTEMARRLEALEQAFATDSRRNRGRTAGGGEDLEEVREAITNLYDIVRGLPSLDTLETKIAAVDGSVEEMHATMEKLLEIGKKLEDHEGPQQSAEFEKIQAELKQGLEVGVKTAEAVARMGEEMRVNSENDNKREKLLGELSKNVETLAGKISGVESKIRGLESTLEGERSKMDALTSQISTMDRNLRTTVDGYRKIYENSARVEKRFVGIEAFLGDIEGRMGAVEANFRPSTQQ